MMNLVAYIGFSYAVLIALEVFAWKTDRNGVMLRLIHHAPLWKIAVVFVFWPILLPLFGLGLLFEDLGKLSSWCLDKLLVWLDGRWGSSSGDS